MVDDITDVERQFRKQKKEDLNTWKHVISKAEKGQNQECGCFKKIAVTFPYLRNRFQITAFSTALKFILADFL